jgi:hypothetical protein
MPSDDSPAPQRRGVSSAAASSGGGCTACDSASDPVAGAAARSGHDNVNGHPWITRTPDSVPERWHAQ